MTNRSWYNVNCILCKPYRYKENQPSKDFRSEIKAGTFDRKKAQSEITSWSLDTNHRIISSLWVLCLCDNFAILILPSILIGVTDRNLRAVMRKMLDAADRLDIQSMMKVFVMNSGLPVNQLSIRRSIFHAFNDLKKVKRPTYFKPEWDGLCSHSDVTIIEKYKVKQRKKIGWKYAVSSQIIKDGIWLWKIKYVKSSGQGFVEILLKFYI